MPQRSLPSLAEQIVTRLLGPLDAVVLTRARIRQTLDEAAERGRLTRSDANELAHELATRGREQTLELSTEFERLLERGREGIDSAARLARRTVGAGSTFPILGYDELTAARVRQRLPKLSQDELRQVREYELRHAKRKTVLASIDRALG